MALYGLLPPLQEAAAFKKLLAELRRGPAQAGGVLGASTGYVLAALQVGLKRPLIAVLPDVERARQVFEELQAWSLAPASAMYFPELEGLPYEEGKASPETVRQRAAVLAELKTRPEHEGRWFKPLVITSAAALFPRVTPPRDFAAQVFTLEQGQKIKPDSLLEEWLRMGFEPAPMVEETGTFTRRGGVLDVFPPAHAQPVRLEFWGDDIESIRLFDPESQLSDSEVKTITFTPMREVSSGMAERALVLLDSLNFDGCREEEAGRWRQALEAIAAGQKAEDSDFYGRFLFERPASLLDGRRRRAPRGPAQTLLGLGGDWRRQTHLPGAHRRALGRSGPGLPYGRLLWRQGQDRPAGRQTLAGGRPAGGHRHASGQALIRADGRQRRRREPSP